MEAYARTPYRRRVVREKPILFSNAMIRAVLAGTKTQTRRVVKGTALEWLRPDGFTPEFVASEENRLCPYGHPGDQLWVRETWRRYGDGIAYRADFHDKAFADSVHAPWKPSIHMPRAAARIQLEVTDVRVERLQAISAEDARAEGHPRREEITDEETHRDAAVDWYRDLWDSINGPGSWNANPWVWVVEFRRLRP
jgi:hypothetical protein